MVPFRAVTYRRPILSPSLGRYRLSQTFDTMFGWTPAVGDAVRLGFHGLSAFLAFHVALREKGGLSALGWIMGFGQAIGAVCDAVSLLKRATGTHPIEEPFPPALPSTMPPGGVTVGF